MKPLRSHRASPRALLLCTLLAAAPGLPGVFGLESIVDPKAEAPATLMDVQLGSGDAQLNVGGSWKGELIAAGGLSFTKLGASAFSNGSPLLFTQTVDLTLSLLILDRWLVEGTFLDDYKLNTYRAAYLGKEGETVRYVGVGNTGLDFPDFPYADLSGATPNSFGAYGAFGAGPLKVHALLRYDAANREEKVYVGSKERTTADSALSARLRGRAFVLPDAELDAAPVVYFEDHSGSLSGSDGRRYRKATAVEASSSAALGLVELASTPSRRVAVAYSKGASASPWTSSLGSYAGSGFLGDTQAAFQDADATIDLGSLPQTGGGSGAPGAIAVGGVPALVVYESGAYSPFESQDRYSPASGSGSDATATLVRKTTGTAVSGFELDESSSSSFTIATTSTGTTGSTSGRYFRLINSGASDKRVPLARYPALKKDPRIYLPGTRGEASELLLRFVSYGGSGSYDIGTDVAAGSVVVTRGGIRDPFASYDSNSGVVALSTPAGAGEIIRISYLKNSQDRRFGSLAAGLGAVYEPEGIFSAKAALTMRWNVSGDAYSADDETNPGSVMLSGGGAWKDKNYKAELNGAVLYENPDTTGLYRGAGMEKSKSTLSYSLSNTIAAYPPLAPAAPTAEAADLFKVYSASDSTGLGVAPALSNRSALLYRDYTVTDVLGNSTLKPIEWTGASVDSSGTGPYKANDSSLGTVYVAEYELGSDVLGSGAGALWAGYQVPLDDEAEVLSRASKIVVPYRFYGLSGSAPIQAFLQIGALADDDDNYESPELVFSYPLNAAAVSGSSYSSSWAETELDLDDAARERLAATRSLRIVVRLAPGSDTAPAAAGRLLTLEPTVLGSGFRPVVVGSGGVAADAGDAASATEYPDASLKAAFSSELSRLHSDSSSQRVLLTAWTGLGTDQKVGVDGYPSPFPLWTYTTLSFYVKGPSPAPSGGVFKVIMAADSSALNEASASSRFLEADIPVSALAAGAWSRVEVDYAKGKVFVNGDRVAAASVVYRSSAVADYRRQTAKNSVEKGPQYLALTLEPASGGTLADGTFSADEFCLESPLAAFGLQGSGALSWKRPGTLLGGGQRPVLADLGFEGRAQAAAEGNPFESAAADNQKSSALASGAASAKVYGAKVGANLGAGQNDGEFRWNAGHSLNAPLGPLTLDEAFSVDPYAESSERKAGLALAGPLSASYAATFSATPVKTTRGWKGALSSAWKKPGAEGSAFQGLAGGADFSSAYVGAASEDYFDYDYGRAYLFATRRLLPDWGSTVLKRSFDGNSRFEVQGAPLGLSVQAGGTSAALSAAATRASGGTLKTAFPLKLGAWTDTFALNRSYTRTDGISGFGDARDDARAFASAMEGAGGLWAQAPFATLDSPTLAGDFGEATNGVVKASYVDGFSDTLALPHSPGLRGLWVPASVEGSLARHLDRSYDTVDDYLAARSGLKFSAANLFGAFGSNPAFSFYKTDEFTSALEGQAKFPKDDSVGWESSLRQSAAFYGFSTAQLSLSNTLKLGSSGWSEGGSIAWTSPVDRSALDVLYRLGVGGAASWGRMPFLSELAKAKETAERRESLEVSVTKGSDFAWSWTAKHESIVKALQRFTLTGFVSLTASGGVSDGDQQATKFLAQTGLSISFVF